MGAVAEKSVGSGLYPMMMSSLEGAVLLKLTFTQSLSWRFAFGETAMLYESERIRRMACRLIAATFTGV
jgi:hypothetical protein